MDHISSLGYSHHTRQPKVASWVFGEIFTYLILFPAAIGTLFPLDPGSSQQERCDLANPHPYCPKKLCRKTGLALLVVLAHQLLIAAPSRENKCCILFIWSYFWIDRLRFWTLLSHQMVENSARLSIFFTGNIHFNENVHQQIFLDRRCYCYVRGS